MNRLAVMNRPALLAIAAAVALVVLVIARPDGHSAYKVDAVFDTAKGIVPGQLVKIGGVRVGKVTDVNLTAERKARLTLRIDKQYTSFRADATCRILPQGLISENFVECAPGIAPEPLPAGNSGTPTVAVERTTVPVDLQDVINVFSLPVDKQVEALINELGIGTAGRGEDLNAILRRANPALEDSRRALSILGEQRRQIASAVAQTDRVLASVAARRGDLTRFIRRAADVTATTASKAKPLGEAVRDLPPLLQSVDRGLASIKRISTMGTPLLRELTVAAPSLTRFTKDIVPFAQAGTPALKTLGTVAEEGRPDLRSGTKTFRQAAALAAQLKPASRQLALLFDSLRKQGGFEAVNKFFYQMAAMSGGYDKTSHFVGVVINVWANCLLNLATQGCSQAYNAPGSGTIPANAPSVGPQRLGTKLPTGAPVLRNADMARMARQNPQRIKALLEYLLK